MNADNFQEKISQLSKEYREHKIYDELISYIDYYRHLSDSVILWFSPGTKTLNFDTYIFQSMKGTLDSIQILLEKGKINDAFALTRKYQDNVVINIYVSLYLEDNHSSETLIVDKINNWLENKEKLPDYRVMSKYIRDSKKLELVNNILFKDDYYKKVRQRLNGHTHYNHFTYMLYNDDETYDIQNNRIKFLEQLSDDLRSIFIKHFVWLFLVKENYMSSSDYIDYLDFGQTPPENSQYWVALFIQETFDNIVKTNRPDLAAQLKELTCMKLD